MKKLLLLLLYAGLATHKSGAQTIMKNGEVLVNDTVYCLYHEGKGKTSNLHLRAQRAIDISEGFKDYYFISKQDGFAAIQAEARVLAHPKEAYLIYYYCFSFLTTGAEFYVRYHPLTIESFAKDVARFGVFKKGFFNNEGAFALIKKWKKKHRVLSEKFVQEGVSEPYIREGKEVVQDSLSKKITIANGNIFLTDSLIATYRPGAPLNPSSFGHSIARTYYVRNLKGAELLVLTVPETRAQAFVLLSPENREFSIICADKSEEKLMRAATAILLGRKKL